MSNPKKRAAAEERLPEKKAKKKKGNTQDDDNLDIELGLNTLFSRMDNQLLADHMLQKTTRFGSDLSSVELSDISLSGKDASMGVLPLPTLPRVMTDR
jgi:protein CMS1